VSTRHARVRAPLKTVNHLILALDARGERVDLGMADGLTKYESLVVVESQVASGVSLRLLACRSVEGRN